MAINQRNFNGDDSPMAYSAPLDRRQIDRTKPYFFLLVAAIFFGISVYSTVMQTGVIMKIGGLQLIWWQAMIVGLIVAAIITYGEFTTSESWVYFAFLAPDVGLTVWWSWEPLLKWSMAAGAGIQGAIIGGIFLGILSAWLPERIVIGQRRKNKKRR
jgi:hypothetical protein